MFIACLVADRAISLRYASRNGFSRINLFVRSQPPTMAFVLNRRKSKSCLRTYHDRFSSAPSRDFRAGKASRTNTNGFEAKDTATLESFLYTRAPTRRSSALQDDESRDAGGKISKIELVDLTADDVKKAATPMDHPLAAKFAYAQADKERSSPLRAKTPAAAQPARAKTSSPRKTANSLSRSRGLVNLRSTSALLNSCLRISYRVVATALGAVFE